MSDRTDSRTKEWSPSHEEAFQRRRRETRECRCSTASTAHFDDCGVTQKRTPTKRILVCHTFSPDHCSGGAKPDCPRHGRQCTCRVNELDKCFNSGVVYPSCHQVGGATMQTQATQQVIPAANVTQVTQSLPVTSGISYQYPMGAPTQQPITLVQTANFPNTPATTSTPVTLLHPAQHQSGGGTLVPIVRKVTAKPIKLISSANMAGGRGAYLVTPNQFNQVPSVPVPVGQGMAFAPQMFNYSGVEPYHTLPAYPPVQSYATTQTVPSPIHLCNGHMHHYFHAFSGQ